MVDALPVDGQFDDACPPQWATTCDNPVADGCQATELCNGLDDNCNGEIDETCTCVPGRVQACFGGRPGRVGVGACVKGTQTCQGGGEFGTWGPCRGGINPTPEVCDDLDNDCNGCPDDGLCCDPPIKCPAPGDIPEAQPFTQYRLDGTQWYSGPALSWTWTIEGGPCDRLLGPSHTVTDGATATPSIHFKLSGDYTVTMTVETPAGPLSCTFIVHVVGPGLRVELCWDDLPSGHKHDLDLHLLRRDMGGSWCQSTADCYYSNCDAGSWGMGSWGYSSSPLAVCQGGPEGADWISRGSCENPRLDIDNFLQTDTGKPENINVDQPRDGESFRVMAHYYSGPAHEPSPLVNIYCNGHRLATYGEAPSLVTGFTDSSSACMGATWRVADVITHINAGVLDCEVLALHPIGQASGYRIKIDDKSYD
jgi:hypothetical protein